MLVTSGAPMMHEAPCPLLHIRDEQTKHSVLQFTRFLGMVPIDSKMFIICDINNIASILQTITSKIRADKPLTQDSSSTAKVQRHSVNSLHAGASNIASHCRLPLEGIRGFFCGFSLLVTIPAFYLATDSPRTLLKCQERWLKQCTLEQQIDDADTNRNTVSL